MEEQQKMPLVLSHFIGNTSSVHGKGNEIQQQCRPIPDEFPHHAPGRAVLLENNFSKSATSVSHGDQKSFPHYFYNYSVNLHNYYTSRWVWTLNTCEHCSKVFTRPKQPVKLRVPYSHFGCNSLPFDFSFNCSRDSADIMWSRHLAPGSLSGRFLNLKCQKCLLFILKTFKNDEE